ncbi:Lrp/AsnC family transcriptional regulator [Pseudomonas sp. N4]|uniref:siroheme decarboxylase subunit beta n=2 Tax=unclassified Pseudomonas TaxID=196821 RepID=UPI0039B7821B
MSAFISPSESLWQAPPRLDETPLALRLVELTQAGLPLLEDPWAWLAEQLELSVESTLDLLKRLQAEGAIRRIAAVPNHYRLGYRHNGMTVWDVADADISRLGALLGTQPFVSHCYRRPRQPGWRYNLFAMVHGRSREEIDSYREHLRYLLGDACSADDMLVSSRILKKTGLRLSPVGAKLARETGASIL